jgi:hypothetical protein
LARRNGDSGTKRAVARRSHDVRRHDVRREEAQRDGKVSSVMHVIGDKTCRAMQDLRFHGVAVRAAI